MWEDSCFSWSGGKREKMESVKLLWVFGVLIIIGSAGTGLGVMGAHHGHHRRCNFPAIFNFGDSNSDTGGRSAAISEVNPPNGETFFGKASGRFSDGRLIIDFISKQCIFLYTNWSCMAWIIKDSIASHCCFFWSNAGEALRLPYLGAYLDSMGTNFSHGANFATGGSSIRPGGYSPFDLEIQLAQFRRFRSQTTALYRQLNQNGELNSLWINPFGFSFWVSGCILTWQWLVIICFYGV